jgi:hypothetical protein
MTAEFDRGVVIVSIDTEQIWGYLDFLTERQFESRYPNGIDAHNKLLQRLCGADVSATWFVVGGLALRDSAGALDTRICGLTPRSIPIPRADDRSAELWYSRHFLERLRDARTPQEIGLHGGLTHRIWQPGSRDRESARRELTEGIQALVDVSGWPRSFSYPRNREAHYDLLSVHGIRSFRGSPPGLSWKLGASVPGAMLRALEEVGRTTPPLVWPKEMLPGLWNIPASMFLYPMGAWRARLIGLGSRVERFSRGLAAAARNRGIFHFCLHPENLAESPQGFAVFDEIVERLIRARQRGDIEILTMCEAAGRMERNQPYVSQQQYQYTDVSGTYRRP